MMLQEKVEAEHCHKRAHADVLARTVR